MTNQNSQQTPKVDLSALPFFIAATPGGTAYSQPDDRFTGAVPAMPTWASDVTQAVPAYQHLRNTSSTQSQQHQREPRNSAESLSYGRPEEDQIWDVVETLKEEVSRQQADALLDLPASIGREAEEALGRETIAGVVAEHVGRTVAAEGQIAAWDAGTQRRVERFLFDRIFRLGRLQPLIDDESIENIHVHGADAVFVQKAGSKTLMKADQVVSSNEELVAFLQQLSRSKGDGARDFSAASPSLHLDLPSGERQVRLHATMHPLTQYPTAIFRIHRHLDITLAQMIEMGTMTAAAAHFLETAVKAGMSIVVSGVPGDGKTTMVRALADNIDSYAQIVTVETERELHLEKLSSRVVPPIAYEYVPAGESGAGERTLAASMSDGLRDNARYLIAGEVRRGDEVEVMVRAMQVGVGTLSTTHAFDPEDCVEALLGLGGKEYGEAYMARQLGRHLNFIVQMGFVRVGDQDLRRITHISEVRHSSDGARRVSTMDIFRLDESQGDTQAQYIRAPEEPRIRKALTRAGLAFGDMEEVTA